MADTAAIRLLPAEIGLTGPEARQRLLVQRIEGGLDAGQITEGVEFESSNPTVVVIEDGSAVPVGNGEATITARFGEQIATALVRVAAMDLPFTWSFRNHVESVLSKAGCNSGACHGAQAGKKGFKISLRGYDPEGDFQVLTRQARGRRIIPSDPARSLILTKPSGAIPHGGGFRYDTTSLEYRVIAEWIAAGTPAPEATDPRLERLEILPPTTVLRPQATQQLVVLAHFDDGHVEDVTRWVKFTSTDQTVAEVDEEGLVRVMGHGEGAVTAWYLSQVVAATITVPYAQTANDEIFAQAPLHNFIDELVLAKLRSLRLPPSPPADDATFIRRAYLDTIGVLPTVEETRRFVADRSADKRERLIDLLLERPEFVDYWTYKWCDLLLVNSEKLPAPAMWSYYNWIRNQVAANTPWDKLVAALLTSSGSTLENGATNFFVLHEDPLELAENTSLAFLGLSIGCARCHNHPLEKWTNDQYFGMANLFSRVRRKTGTAAGQQFVFAAATGELIQPLRGKPQPPRPLDGEAIPFERTTDRRDVVADWVTSPGNPYFARAITNRVWANFLGRGLVENVDDLRLTNPASNAELHEALADYLVEHQFDLKALMREILRSATYQRASEPTSGNEADTKHYAHYYPRRMMAEVMIDAFSQVTGAPTEFPGYPAGWRALQLPDSSVDSYFLKTFGRPERVITCECERVADPSMVQVLHMSNGDAINRKLVVAKNRIGELIESGAGDPAIVEDLYLSALSRMPAPEERQQIIDLLAATPAEERRAAIEDLYWGILSSKEFLFNH
ncbi:MAG: DUF1549 domain-containing protein [Pirellulales bacterium]|nr:DUF1549 domain-containing protein [Pirellulales bacterium]